MPEDDALADLLAFVLAGRPERLTAAAVGQMSPDHRAAVGPATETLAALALEQTQSRRAPGCASASCPRCRRAEGGRNEGPCSCATCSSTT